jgi:hypothetical protein
MISGSAGNPVQGGMGERRRQLTVPTELVTFTPSASLPKTASPFSAIRRFIGFLNAVERAVPAGRIIEAISRQLRHS